MVLQQVRLKLGYRPSRVLDSSYHFPPRTELPTMPEQRSHRPDDLHARREPRLDHVLRPLIFT